MKRAIIFITALIFCTLLHSANISGYVNSKTDGQAIEGVKILLLKSTGLSFKTSVTDHNGYFEFKNIKSGNYTMKTEHGDYLAHKERIKLIENIELLISLEEIIIIIDESTIELEEDCDKPMLNYNHSRKTNSNLDGAYYSGSGSGNTSYEQAPETWNTESYDFINENNFRNVLSDPLSTFSIDVDRAAYANVRRFLNQSTMPYADAIRIEEMINYFDYNYPQPTGEHPFSTSLELGKCPWNEEHQLLLIGIQGEKVDTEDIPATNLVFLIDVSGSMSSGNKLPLLKQSFKILVDQLRPKDRVAIVVYAGAAGCVLESTSGNEKSKILASLDMLEAGGSTAGGAGINLAYKIAKQNFIQGGNNRVILATDGDFNIGESSDASMERLIEEKRDDGVFLTVLGFGMGNYKDSKMEKLSNKGNGNYAYIDNIMEARKIFSEELWGTLYTIAKDVKIQIEFNPNLVKGYRLIGYENRLLNDEDFNDDTKDAGEIGSGHCVTALYELIPANSEEKVGDIDKLNYQKLNIKKSNDLMTLKIRYKNPNEEKSLLIETQVRPSDMGKISNNFRLAASIAEFGMLLRDSEFKGNSSYEEALTLAKQARGEDSYGYRSEYISLIEKADLLSR